jgi:hypothetical protein
MRDAADGDPAAATLHADLDTNRHTRMRHYPLSGRRWHTDQIRLAEATDVLWTYSSPDFDLRPAPPELRRYSQFIIEAITNALL